MPPQSMPCSNDLPLTHNCFCITCSLPEHILSPPARVLPSFASPHKPHFCPQFSTWLPLSITARSLNPLPQAGHPLLGQGCRALTSLSPLLTTSCREAQGGSEGRKGRTEQRLPETTVTGTGSQRSLFINLWTTKSKDSISSAHHIHGPQAHCTHVDTASGQQGGVEPAGLVTGASPKQSFYRTPGREARSPMACTNTCRPAAAEHPRPPCTSRSAVP